MVSSHFYLVKCLITFLATCIHQQQDHNDKIGFHLVTCRKVAWATNTLYEKSVCSKLNIYLPGKVNYLRNVWGSSTDK